MTRWLLTFLVLGIAPRASGQEVDLRVIPNRQAGPVRATSTFASLLQQLGPHGVTKSDVHLGEGVFEPGATLFPDDSLRSAVIYFADTLGLSHPLGVSIASPGTRWKLPSGIAIGTSLARLQELNGRPFAFSGFGWDYGGKGTDWQGGNLATVLGKTMELAVTLPWTCPAALTPAQVDSLVGDRVVTSDNPVADRACIQVREIWVGFAANRQQ